MNAVRPSAQTAVERGLSIGGNELLAEGVKLPELDNLGG